MNLVMDDVVEHYESELAVGTCQLTTDNEMPERTLGLVVLRGPNVVLISPTDGLAGELLPDTRADDRNREPLRPVV